jgi:hypothetical protein
MDDVLSAGAMESSGISSGHGLECSRQRRGRAVERTDWRRPRRERRDAGFHIGRCPEEIRSSTLWYLARGYAPDPGRLPATIKEAVLAEPAGASSDREEFGRELLRRMYGEPAREDERWLAWLDTKEADILLMDDMDVAAHLTTAEFTVRDKRCKMLAAMQCPVRKTKGREIPSETVSPPAFQLPSELPAGLADAVMASSRCKGTWLTVASATSDRAGRVRDVIMTSDARNRCARAYETLARLSLITPSDIRTPLATGSLLFVANGKTPCLDEEKPSEAKRPPQVGGKIRAPVVRRRVEPIFPESARRRMGPNAAAAVIVEALITKTGCIRSVRLLSQSPFPEVNGAAILAISQWELSPGMLGTEPVDVIFNLNVTFKTNYP